MSDHPEIRLSDLSRQARQRASVSRFRAGKRRLDYYPCEAVLAEIARQRAAVGAAVPSTSDILDALAYVPAEDVAAELAAIQARRPDLSRSDILDSLIRQALQALRQGAKQ